MSEEFEIREVNRSKDSIGRLNVALCFDNYSDRLLSTAHLKNEVKRWKPNLEPDGSLDQVVNTPNDVASVEEGILVCERVNPNDFYPAQVAVLGRDGRKKETYLSAPEKMGSGTVLPLRAEKAITSWQGERIYLSDVNNNRAIVESKADEGISRADIGSDESLYYVTYNCKSKEPFVYKLKGPDYTDSELLFQVDSKDRIEAIRVNPMNGALLLVSSEGIVQCCNEKGHKLAKNFDTKLGSNRRYAAAFSPEGQLYVVGTRTPILELKIKPK